MTPTGGPAHCVQPSPRPCDLPVPRSSPPSSKPTGSEQVSQTRCLWRSHGPSPHMMSLQARFRFAEGPVSCLLGFFS